MVTKGEFSSPFYSAYISQFEVVNAAIEKAVKESAAKMGNEIVGIYSIHSSVILKKKIA